MIHENKAQFTDIINMATARTGFRALLMEKDYHLTRILSKINDLSDDLIFKGGTCLNKIYYSYYRLSEDLDFSMRLPEYKTTRPNRRKSIQPIKDKIEEFAKRLGFRIEGVEKTGRNESRQYVYYLGYSSVLQSSEQLIKLEIGLRFNPICAVEKRAIHHKFLHPFTGDPLFEGGKVNCLQLKEIVSEKLRAAALREVIAPRDFYDLDFIIRHNFNLADREMVELFRKKVEEDGGDLDLTKYHVNLGRSDAEMNDMRSRIEKELFDVLTAGERENFDLVKALERINEAMKGFK